MTANDMGCLIRRTSVAPDPAAAAEAVVAARQRISEAVARSSGMPSMPEERPSDTGARPCMSPAPSSGPLTIQKKPVARLRQTEAI